MKVMRLGVVMGLLCVGLTLANGDDKKGDKKGESFKDTPKVVAAAATVDFTGELGLDFNYLRGLGVRIDLARSAGDPVGLAACAKELGVAEKASGKMASVKSADLLKEATEAALRRGSLEELTAMADIVSDAKAKKELEDAAKKVKQEIADRKDGKKRGITGNCKVTNNTEHVIGIWINDSYVGRVDGFAENTFYVGDSPYDTTKLLGRWGSRYWGPRYVPQNYSGYTWNLFP